MADRGAALPMMTLDPAPWIPQLETERARRLPRLRAEIARRVAHNATQPGPAVPLIQPKSDFDCDPSVTRELEAHQGWKCVWCGRKIAEGDLTLEHYRYKAYYWWLAWSSANLLAACSGCQSRKGDRFDLLDPNDRLVAEASPPGAEVPLLPHPAEAAAKGYFSFQLGPDGRWAMVGGTPSADILLKALRLNQRYGNIFQDRSKELKMAADPIRQLLDRGDLVEAQQRWALLLDTFLTRETDLPLLVHAWLTQHFAIEIAEGDLTLPPTQIVALPVDPGRMLRKSKIEAYPAAVRDLIYAVGARAEAPVWHTALSAVLNAAGPATGATEADLLVLFDTSRETLRGHLGTLGATRRGPCWYTP